MGASFSHDQADGDLLSRADVVAVRMEREIGRWRANPNVPPQVRELLDADHVYRAVLEVEEFDCSPQLARFIEQYTETIRSLNADEAGETRIKVREPVLWKWCKFNIKNIAQRFDLPHDACDARLREAVADTKLMLVIFNVLLDDVADDLQDTELLALLSQIPRASGKFGVAAPTDYAWLRARLPNLGRQRFERYFDLCVEIWMIALSSLATLTGDGYLDLLSQFADDYDRILSAMRLSVDLNLQPRKTFYLSPAELDRRYGEQNIGEVLSHNANVGAFFTIDLMLLRNLDGGRYKLLVLSGAVDVCRRAALLSQDMMQLGNSIATAARELGSDDLSNELFKVANDLLNQSADWRVPDHLREFDRCNLILTLFERKRAIAGLSTEEAERKRTALAADILQLFALSGAEQQYFARWLHRREELAQVRTHVTDVIDEDHARRADDLLLVMHLIYKGRI